MDAGMRKRLEDELMDSGNWFDYLLPRPIRRFLYVVVGAQALWGAAIKGSALLSMSAGGRPAFGANSTLENFLIDIAGVGGMIGLYFLENKWQAQRTMRREQRKKRKAQRIRQEQEYERQRQASLENPPEP